MWDNTLTKVTLVFLNLCMTVHYDIDKHCVNELHCKGIMFLLDVYVHNMCVWACM